MQWLWKCSAQSRCFFAEYDLAIKFSSVTHKDLYAEIWLPKEYSGLPGVVMVALV